MWALPLVGVAIVSWLLFKRKPAVEMPAIGNSAVVHSDGNRGNLTVQFVQKGAGFGWEPFEFSGVQNLRVPINGSSFWKHGSKRRIPVGEDRAGLYAWQSGLNLFTLLAE